METNKNLSTKTRNEIRLDLKKEMDDAKLLYDQARRNWHQAPLGVATCLAEQAVKETREKWEKAKEAYLS